MKVVLGGGIGGLSAAYYLRVKYPQDAIKIYESSKRIGGWIKSEKLPNGVIFEQGPRTLRPKGVAGANTLQLIHNLSLSTNITPIISSQPVARNRMIYANGELHLLPSGLKDIFMKKSPFSKAMISYILQDLFAKQKKIEDESIYSFVERRFGKEIAQYAISPLICGICAGDAKEISVNFLMKTFFEKEQKYGGVIKGLLFDRAKQGIPELNVDLNETILVDKAKSEKWSVYSFKDGMEKLPTTLAEELKFEKVDILLNSNCEQIEFIDNKCKLTINGSKNEEIIDYIISSLPSNKLAPLLINQHPELSKLLQKIPSVDVVVINLYYKENLNLEEAFGFLVPPSENLPILGVIYDSCTFPKTDGTVLTVMMGGHWFKKHFGDSPTEEFLLKTAKTQLQNILQISRDPDSCKVSVLRNCIAQYVVGHNKVVNQIENYIQANKLPIAICGSSYYGVGVNDVILSAKDAVEDIEIC